MCFVCSLPGNSYLDAAVFGADAGSVQGSVTGAGLSSQPTTPPVSDEVDPTGFNAFFDIPGNTFTATTLFVNSRINAEISNFFTPDSDWFGVVLQQGQTYRITANSIDFFGFGLQDPRVALFDNFGNLLTFDSSGGSGQDAILTVTATRNGIYYVGVDSGTVGDIGQYEVALTQINLTADNVGQTKKSAAVIAVDAVVSGTIDTPDDQDWYQVRLEKGRVYSFEMDGDFFSSSPLGDPLLEIRSAKGRVIASNDDDGVSYNAFTTTQIGRTGTYFVRAQSNSDTTGDFKLMVSDITPPAPPSPLEALDWGVKLDSTDITYYFAKAGETYGTVGKLGSETTDSDWSDYEKGQAALAFAEYSKVSPLTFRQVDSPDEADFKLSKSFLASGLTGKMAPPDSTFSPDEGVGWFNTNSTYWTDEAGGLLERGAYGLSNFLHEFGHAMGLSHPHDNGSGEAGIMDGVFSSTDAGTFQLNQEVFTVMSYNKGWKFGDNGEGSGTNAFGIARTLMAFDIAQIQKMYGAVDHAEGKNTYKLFTANERGTGYEAIWDTGGRDRIVNKSGIDAVIDLRPATLKLEEGGGGFVSYAKGIFGGFTIANGVRIEIGIGGKGDDSLTGNGLRNTLKGKGGDDRIDGGANKDRLIGGGGDDIFVFSRNDGADTIKDFGKGADQIDLTAFNLAGFGAVEALFKSAGDDLVLDLPGKGDVTLLRTQADDLGPEHFLI